MSKSIANSTALVLASFFIAAAFDYTFGVGMSWILTPEEYGALGVSMSYFLLLSLFVASGFPMSLAKTLAETARPPRGLIRFAAIGNLLVALVASAIFVALTFHGPLSPGPGYGRLTITVAAAIVLLSVGSTLQFALQGRMEFRSFAILHAAKSASRLFVGVGLALLGFGVAGALGGLIVGAVVITLAAGIMLHKGASRKRIEPTAVSSEAKRRFLRYTLAIFAGSIALTLLMNLDLLTVKYLTTGAESNRLAGYYQSASVLTRAPLWAVTAAMSVFFPIMSRANNHDPEAANRIVANVLRWAFLGLAPIVASLTLFPRLMLSLAFPDVYVAAAPALAVGALGLGALGITFILTRALQASNRAKAPGIFLIASAVLQFVLLLIAVPRWGIVGAAGATTVACLAGAIPAAIVAKRAFDLRFSWIMVAKLASAVAILALFASALNPVTRFQTILALSAGYLAYGVALITLGLITRSEQQRVLDFAGETARRFGLRPGDSPEKDSPTEEV